MRKQYLQWLKIEVIDDVDPGCSATTIINTPNCTLPCSITNLVATAAGAGGSGAIHNVNVEDFIFNPSVINITAGDQVEWIWVGNVDHTATSDATSGPDSWDSGLLGNGATHLSPVLSEGTHPYYCIPHGNPGGAGMAGTIYVLPPCNATGEVMVTLTFDVASNGTSGFEVLVDGVSVGTFSYVGGSAQSATVNVPGDNLLHTIEVRDVSDAACSVAAIITTPDCNGGGTASCMLDVAATLSGGCDSNNQVPVDLIVTASDQGSNFEVKVDGVSQGSFGYTGSLTNINVSILGDGLTHLISIVDALYSNCTTSALINMPNCDAKCSIDNIHLNFLENTKHIIHVEDFEFIPKDINITIGDTLEFIWVGVIPHTVTSDVSTGSSAFESGLLSQGANFQVIPKEIGNHPYYCVPHGAPGGIGMAGNINVQTICNEENAIGNLSFNYEGTSENGFSIHLDGVELSESPLAYNPLGSTNATISVIGDSLEHILSIADLNNPSCADSIMFDSPSCTDEMCTLTLSLNSLSACDGANVDLSLNVTSSLSKEKINFYKNGILINNVPLETDVQGNFNFIYTSLANGMDAEFSVAFSQHPDCNDQLIIDIPDCDVPGLISEFQVGFTAKHEILVRDFDFFPSDIDVLVGDTILFTWKGAIPHTSSSDVTEGMDSWESGLLEMGDSFEIVINSAGQHPYYCIPHGGPGGIGMAAVINAFETCNLENWNANYSFSVSAGSPLGYNLFLDGALLNSTPIQYSNPIGFNQSSILLPGDEDSHFLTIQDVETNFCAFTTNVITTQCSADCTIKKLEANVGDAVIHEVEVRDFDFFPSEITIRAGETVRFLFTGLMPHTATSDAINLPDSWDSGLLNQGDTFDIVINTIGDYPYYCIPHGGPDGIGQSGVIEVLPQCNDGEQQVTVTFEANGGSSDGYKLFVDGTLIEQDLIQYENSKYNHFYIIKCNNISSNCLSNSERKGN